MSIDINKIATKSQLLQLIKDNANEYGNMSIRGTAMLADCQDTDIVRGAAFSSVKLGERLEAHGFKAAAFSKYGIPPKAVILILEYFAYHSNSPKEQARQLLLTFSSIGILTTLEEVLNKPEQQPSLEDVDYMKRRLGIAEEVGNVLKRNLKNKTVAEQLVIRILGKAAPSEYQDIFEEAKNSIANEAAIPINELYTATDISKVLVEKGYADYSSPQKVNQLLKQLGLQTKANRKGARWKATTLAKQEDLAKEVVVTASIKAKTEGLNGHTQLKWKETIFDYIYKELKEQAA